MAKALLGHVGGPDPRMVSEMRRLQQRIRDSRQSSSGSRPRTTPSRRRHPRRCSPPAGSRAGPHLEVRSTIQFLPRDAPQRRPSSFPPILPCSGVFPGCGRPSAGTGSLPRGRHSREGADGSVYLKTLTLRGFKSFASATTLRFEPGITCVVGPNGSGKSNVVDALAWVMGEQGAKSLRGGKMEDVIFAGTPSRPPLGRAEVTLTIDNTDGALPIDYAEVTITPHDVPVTAGASTPSTATPAGCWTSRNCCPTPASAARCTSSSARASSTPCCTPARRTAGRSSRRPRASSSTASARRRRCASWTRCRPT